MPACFVGQIIKKALISSAGGKISDVGLAGSLPVVTLRRPMPRPVRDEKIHEEGKDDSGSGL